MLSFCETVNSIKARDMLIRSEDASRHFTSASYFQYSADDRTQSSDVNLISCLRGRADIYRRVLKAVGTFRSSSYFGQCASWLYVVTHSSCDLLLLMTLEAGRSRGPRVERGAPYLSWLSGLPLYTLGLKQKRFKKKMLLAEILNS